MPNKTRSNRRGLDQGLEHLLARCLTEADMAQRFVSRLSANGVGLVVGERRQSSRGSAYPSVQECAASIARQDPEYVATVIRNWMSDGR